ncbi:MAG: hypothetical protein ACYDCD_10525 [Candidatus Acidiferrales bacterium]
MSKSIETSRNRPQFSVNALARKLFAEFAGLVLLISIVVVIIAVTLRITAIHSSALRVLAGGADVILGTSLLLAGIYVVVRLFVSLLASKNIS